MHNNNNCEDKDLDLIRSLLEKELSHQIENKSFSTKSDIFGQAYTSRRDEAAGEIKDYKAKIINKDINSKLKFRDPAIRWLFWLLLIQTVFMNLIVGAVFASQLCKIDWFLQIDIETLKTLTDLAKWYATAVLAELLSIFCCVIIKLFEKPQF